MLVPLIITASLLLLHALIFTFAMCRSARIADDAMEAAFRRDDKGGK